MPPLRRGSGIGSPATRANGITLAQDIEGKVLFVVERRARPDLGRRLFETEPEHQRARLDGGEPLGVRGSTA